MKKLSSCILIEWRKLIKSKLSIVTACSICLVPFIVGLFATMMKYPENFKNLGLISAKMEMMRITDWSSYLMTPVGPCIKMVKCIQIILGRRDCSIIY